MRVTAHPGAPAFLEAIEPEFGSREVEHHLMLGIARAATEQPRAGVFLTLRDGVGLAMAAFMTPPRPLILATIGTNAGAAAEVARWLFARDAKPSGFIADEPAADAFRAEWRRLGGEAAMLKMRQRLFVLRQVAAVPRSAGTLRRATLDDRALVEEWTIAFHGEAMFETNDPELRDRVVQRIASGEVYLWMDGGARSMAASARRTRRGVAVNSVYTPPEWRGRGYATTCVATLSQHLIDAGRDFCVLYTDLANPTSNAIYARIGYRPVADSVFYRLGAP